MTTTKERPIAKLAIGLSSAKLYRHRIEWRRGGGSIDGAQARIENRGWRGQKTYVIIEGPYIAFAEKLGSNSGLARRQAQRFVAEVNKAAMALERQ